MTTKLLNAKAAQKYIGISEAIWKEYRTAEDLPVSTTLGKRKLYHVDDLDRWINERKDTV